MYMHFDKPIILRESSSQVSGVMWAAVFTNLAGLGSNPKQGILSENAKQHKLESSSYKSC